MRNPWMFYVLAMILFVLGFIDLAFLKYSSHTSNGILVTVWGVASLIWGVRLELRQRQ